MRVHAQTHATRRARDFGVVGATTTRRIDAARGS
jgi:hypothetical protein